MGGRDSGIQRKEEIVEDVKREKMIASENCFANEATRMLHAENFFDVIQYIIDHDAGMVKPMLKKSRLENFWKWLRWN